MSDIIRVYMDGGRFGGCIIDIMNKDRAPRALFVPRKNQKVGDLYKWTSRTTIKGALPKYVWDSKCTQSVACSTFDALVVEGGEALEDNTDCPFTIGG